MELQHTIKQYYGSEFDACKYLDRFFDLRIVLPDISTEKFLSSLGIEERANYLEATVRKMINNYNFSMREICKYIRICNMAISPRTSYINYSTVLVEEIIAPLIVALHMRDMTSYYQFINGNNPLPLEQLYKPYNIEDYYSRILFSDDELRNKSRTDNPQPEIKNRIEEIYNAIFVYDYADTRQIKIGNFFIRSDTKRSIERVAGMLSIITNINAS